MKIEAALFKPFGEQSEWVLPGNTAPETKGWIGERYDADAGLQYLNARYYDPELSLFLQPDWFEVTKAGGGTNRFSYSASDPVNKFDPGGNEYQPLPTSQMWLEAWYRGNNTAPQKFWWGGTKFESAVLRSMGLPKNSRKFDSAERRQLSRNGWGNVIPDAIVRTAVEAYSPQAVTLIAGPESDVGVGYVEANASGYPIFLKTADYQILGQIEALSGISKVTGVPGELWLVTTADTPVAGDLVAHATGKGVVVTHSSTEYDPETGLMRVLDGVALNPEVALNGGVGRSYGGPMKEVPLILDDDEADE